MWQWVVVVIVVVLFLLLASWFVMRLLRVPAVASWDALLDDAAPEPSAVAAAAPVPTATAGHTSAPQPAAVPSAAAALPIVVAEPPVASAVSPAALLAPEPDDLTRIEGIGPKLSDVLRDAGVATFAALAGTAVEELQRIVDAAGPRFSLADPGTWPQQAALAAAADWDGLAALQGRLDAGRR